jgi:hypothetical protein
MTSQSRSAAIRYASSTTASTSGAHARSGRKPTDAHSVRIWDSKGIQIRIGAAGTKARVSSERRWRECDSGILGMRRAMVLLRLLLLLVLLLCLLLLLLLKMGLLDVGEGTGEARGPVSTDRRRHRRWRLRRSAMSRRENRRRKNSERELTAPRVRPTVSPRTLLPEIS